MGDGRKALQQSRKRGPRSRAPIQPRDILDKRNERPGADGRRTSVGQFGRRTDRRRHAAISPASAETKFSPIPSMADLPVSRNFGNSDHVFYGLAGSSSRLA